MNFMIEDLQIVETPNADRDYRRIAKAIAFIVAARPRQPSLEELAAEVDLSSFHLQRLFKRWAGVSPKQLAGYLALEHAKAVMRASASVLDAAFETGLSGPSRLHDLFVTFQAMTPGEYRAQGRDLEIRHGVCATPFGRALILTTDRGVCGVEFVDEDDSTALAVLRGEWPHSRWVADQATVEATARNMFSTGEGRATHLLLRGTNFQIQVWAALMRLPEASIVSYGDIARFIGRPSAGRAVGAAVARNPIAYLVPCHRVLRANGLFKHYKWGADRRHAILAWEAAHAHRAEF
jgi:AraC family transcriptional regulator of adaptative response/methylated-DNA-[protein]-cysteine methyltransferase